MSENNLNVPSLPNYYSIIPAGVRYDKNLSFAAKVIFGELTALANIHGYCFCTNKYLADLFSLNVRQIQRILHALQVRNHIKIEFGLKNKRKIFIITTARINIEDKIHNYNNLYEYDWLNDLEESEM